MLDVECRARGTPMSKRSDSSTTAGSSSPNPPHPTCACSASNTLLAEWSTTPPTVSVFEQSGCDNMRCGGSKTSCPFSPLQQIPIETLSPKTSFEFPSSTNRVANSDSPPICSDQNSKCSVARETALRGIRFRIAPTLHTDLYDNNKRCYLYSIEKLTLLLQM